MTPFKQLFEHDPKNGVYGDCHRTAIGSIFDIPPEQMPHFYENDRSEVQARRLVSEWLAARGMTQILVPVGGFVDAADEVRVVLSKLGRWNGGQHYLLSGTSRTGVGHTVVCLNDAIISDPSQTDAGIVGPLPDGLFWVTFFGSALASSRAAPRQ